MATEYRALKVKGLDIYIPPLTRNMTSSGLQFKVAYSLAMTLDGTAQVAAAHFPNERTLDPAVCSYAAASHTVSFTPAMFSGNNSLFLVASITRY